MSQLRNLEELMQTLPQEIFEHVYDLTFTAAFNVHSADRPLIDHGPIDSYSDLDLDDFSPALLKRPKTRKLECNFVASIAAPDTLSLFHVDSSSRRQFGRSYFGGGTFIFKEAKLLAPFLLSTELEFADLVRSVKIRDPKHVTYWFPGVDISNDWLFYMFEYIPYSR